MFNPRNSIRALLVAALVSVLTISAPSVVSAESQSINFKLLYQAANLANQAYEGKSQILGNYPPRSSWVSTPGNNNVQYVLLHNDKRKVQAIAVRGTVDSKNMSLDMETSGVRDKKAGILMHQGFRAAAITIYKDVKSRLKPNYTTHLTGHSLGGAAAAILGIYLIKDGFKVAGIYTFGQPKFTNVAGAKAYRKLPLLRVINQNDTVALLPNSTKHSDQQYAHMGAAVNLLSGPYYVYGPADKVTAFSAGLLPRIFNLISVPDHKIKWYLRSISQKLNGAKRVSFEDRNKYIVRHRAGKFYGDPIKRKSNFNHHY